MKITSPAFKDNEMIPMKYTCDGADINPPLIIEDIPEETATLALVMDDPDAPGGTWIHWLIWNIDPECDTIIENYSPEEVNVEIVVLQAVEGTTSAGTVGYHGPCPPLGIHHYQFKAYALDIILPLVSSATKKELEKVMKGHIVEQALLVGLYERR